MTSEEETQAYWGRANARLAGVDEVVSFPGPTIRGEHIPVLLQCTTAYRAEMFEGGILPKPGDVVEMVCYEVSERDGMTSVKCRWRVRSQE